MSILFDKNVAYPVLRCSRNTTSARQILSGGQKETMHIEINDPALEARIQKQIHATGSASAEEALLHLLETQEEQDRWLTENRDTINAKIRRCIAQLNRVDTSITRGISPRGWDAFRRSKKATAGCWII